MRHLFLVLLLFTCSFSSAQYSLNKDSLYTLLRTAKEDTSKVRLLYTISKFYQTKSPDSVMLYAGRAEALNTKLGNASSPVLMANVNLMIGKAYHVLGNFNQNLQHFLTAAEYAEKSRDAKTIGMVLVHIGQYYQDHDMQEKGIPYLHRAINLFIQIGDSMKLMEATSQLGITQKELRQFDEAEKNLTVALNYSLLHNKMMMEHFTRGQLALVRSMQGRHTEAIQILQQNYASSVQTNDLADYYFMMGDEYLALKNYNQAIIEYNKGLPIALENNITQTVADFYEMMSEAYAGINDYRNAYHYSHQSRLMKDTIYDVARQDEMIRMQEQYESEKKDKEIVLLNKDKQLKAEEASHQKLVKNISVAGLIIALLFVFVLFSRYKIKQRTTKQLEEKNKLIEKEKERAEQSEKFKSKFLANMSHEIRTPMNAVIGMAHLMEDTRLDEKQRRYLNAIIHSSENLLVIINDVLDLSKLEAGKMELEKIPFRIDDVLNTVFSTLKYKAEEKSLHFTTTKEETIPDYLKGDPSRLAQVLLNLAGNAVKFTENGSVTINVENISGTEASADCSLRFSIVDTGVGIPKDKLSSIFESFKQASEGTARRYGGTGLGLSISQQIVQLHGGNINVESEEGKGSVFSFTVSYDVTTENEFEKAHFRHETVDFEFLRGTKILLAEDNIYNQEVAVQSMMRLVSDLTIDIAEDGNRVLELLSENDYDIILMDVQMPGMDGYEATKHIREDFSASKKNIPIIALTASATREEINEGYKAGMSAYVAKPFKPDVLLIKIAEQLNKNGSAANHFEKSKIKRTSSLIDLSLLKEITGNDKMQMKHFINRFIKESQNSFSGIEESISKENYTEVKRQLHIFRPQVESMGITSLVELLYHTEQNAKAGVKAEDLLSQIKAGKKMCESAIAELLIEVESSSV
jgi:signal transduction histidine kinase/CheY-like chemotaxis protein/HPt (histidine-containing phosphotransfer) domain-containing protein